MIPKILHLCWLSDDPMPASIQKYIETWKRVLPDYEIRKWDFTRFPKDKSIWVSEAFDAKKYAFAADYIRNYALYHDGGIYLDSDIEVLKSFDELLHLPYFLGFENGSGNIDAGIMGSEPGNPIFQHMLDYYEGKRFVNPDGSINNTPLPKVMNDVLRPIYEIIAIDKPDDFNPDKSKICVLPFDFFSPIHQETRRLESTDRTMAIHQFAASWQSGWPKYRRIIKNIVGPDIYQYFIKMKRALIGRSKA